MAKVVVPAIPVPLTALLALLGRELTDPAVKAVLAIAGKTSTSMGSIYAKEAGFEIGYQKDGDKRYVYGITVYREGYNKHRQFRDMPRGFAFGPRRDILAALPPPLESRKRDEEVVIERWIIDQYEYLTNYGDDLLELVSITLAPGVAPPVAQVEQAEAPRMVATKVDDTFGEALVALVAKPLSDKQVKAMLARAGLALGKRDGRHANAAVGVSYYASKFDIAGKQRLGVSAVCFHDAGQTEFVRDEQVTFERYPAALPRGLALGMTRAAVASVLGPAENTHDVKDFWYAGTRYMGCSFADDRLVSVFFAHRDRS